MYSVEFAYNIVPSDEAGQGLSNLLIRQLAAIESGKGLQQAARSLGVSYRYFWGQIEIWEERFGQKLVIREQGKRARLSPLGQKLLWAERTVMANYAVQMEKMRTELNAAFAAACNPDADIVTIAGCFDPWLATLPAFLFPSHHCCQHNKNKDRFLGSDSTKKLSLFSILKYSLLFFIKVPGVT